MIFSLIETYPFRKEESMVYNTQDYDIFIGIDVDQKSFSFTVKDHGQMNRSHRIPADPENLYRHIENVYNGKRVICAYETGGSGYHLHDYLTSRDIRCLMVPPVSIPKAGNDRTKNNRLDSERISQHLKNGDMSPIRVPDYDFRELRQLSRSRQDYVNLGRITKQRIKALLLFSHLNPLIKDTLQNWSGRYLKRLKVVSCTPATRQRLDLLLTDLEYARNQQLKVINELRAIASGNTCLTADVHYLRSIPGIGFITAITILANIGDPRQLNNPRELGAFIGLVPREHSTGDKICKGSITHMGDVFLRSLLIEASWVIIRKDKRMRQFYDRIRSRHHPHIAARKAIVAVARKLTLIIYRVLKEQREYIAY
jgi:transposase